MGTLPYGTGHRLRCRRGANGEYTNKPLNRDHMTEEENSVFHFSGKSFLIRGAFQNWYVNRRI